MLRTQTPSSREVQAGPRLSSVWVWVVLLLPFTVTLGARLWTVDLAYGIRAGQLMLETREILAVDVFLFSSWCDPWLNQQWGADLAFAGVYGSLGWLGLAALRATLAAGVAGITYLACRASGASRRAAAWLALLAWAPHMGGQLRAQFFGLLLLAAVLWIVAARREHPNRLPWVIPIALVWANTHGSFPLALVVLGAAVLEDAVERRPCRRLVVITGLTAVATVVTPFGPRVWSYVADLSADPVIREVVTEWQPPWSSWPTGIAFFGSGAVAIVVFSRHRHAVPWPAWLQLAVFTYLAATAMRAFFFFSIVLCVTLARLPWARRADRPDPRHPIHGLFVGACVLFALVALGRWVPYGGTVPPETLVEYAPQALTRELRSVLRPGEPFANPQAWGSWFELELPGHPVFVDSRFEVMPPDVVRASGLISQARPGWEETLDALPVRVLVVDRDTQAPLVAALGSNADWQRVYSDAEGFIFVRRGFADPPVLPPCAAAPA